MVDPVLIDILKAVPAIILCYIIWRWFQNRVERDRNLIKAQEHYNHGRLDRGNVWIHSKTGRPYTVLWLTNTGVNKSNWRKGWEINVTYTNDFEQIWNRPYSEFCQKFHHYSRGENEEHFTLTLMAEQMIHNTKICLPKEGETWFKGTVHATDPELIAQGHPSQTTTQTRVHINHVLALEEAHPVVVFTVNEKQTAMLLSQFIFTYRKEVSFDGSISSCV